MNFPAKTLTTGLAHSLRLAVLLTAVSAMAASPAAARDQGAGQLLVKFRHDIPAQAASAAVRSADATQVGKVPELGISELRLPPNRVPSALRHLRLDSRVAFVERNARVGAFVTPNDYWWPSEWAPPKVNAPTAWELSTGSPETVIAVLDSGVDYSQPDLQGAFVPGRDIVNNDADPSDDYGHGTEVAGVAAARSNNATGVASYCWTCSIMPVKVLDSTGSGTVSNVASGIVWATEHGARVINMSLGTTSSSSTLASAAQFAHEHGVVLVAAAGNSSSTTPNYPAALPTVIGVAGSDSLDQLTSTSNYGSWVKVAAPGCNFTTGMNSWYGTFCGTSSASPVVAGIAGLALSRAPGASNTEIEAAIESSAVPVSYVQYGRVDAAATLNGVGSAPVVAGAAPTLEAAPTISGAPQQGTTLSATSGTWSGSPSAYAYQWQRCDSSGAGCAAIAGATAPSYTASLADLGSTLRTQVTASNAYGSSSALSAPTAVVASAPNPTATFSGSISAKQPSRTFGLTVGSGTANATLTFTKASALTLTLLGSDGSVVGTVKGPSGIKLTSPVSSGSYRYTVSGESIKGSASFTLTVSYPPA